MDISIHADPATLGRAAACEAASRIIGAIRSHGQARIVVATGASQFATLEALVSTAGIDWSKVEAFHLDEYIGITDSHPASFRRYLRERFVTKAPGLATFHPVDGNATDPQAECRRLGAILGARPVDVLLLGIGENGHLAFNDPPADVTTRDAYLVVDLDEACRRQQLCEGWFPDLAAVPRQAMSMSIPCLLSARSLIASVPDQRKAEAVRGAVEGPMVPTNPGAYLRAHPRCSLHVDAAAATLLHPLVTALATRR